MTQRSTRARSRVLLGSAGRALRMWTARQWQVALVASAGFAVIVGTVTVLIPNPVFTREIDTVWWNYPVWLLTSLGAGMLTATYLRPQGVDPSDIENSPGERRTTRMGIAGGLLAWFAVGCPVCNKIAVLALGYSGAITWFAPLQPVLAITSMLLTGIALLWRLRGQVSCPVLPAAGPHPAPRQTEALR
ncbi:hypothetical protein [Leucobacter triazinivorans]|uniref:Uncharacterized protein n=1 Tax=Leucobacter triazinivorans TaxID=1784719 RepID=A0A4P6KFR6_9MICO|nr:hypothetical protein [Leucobacter triazinivorans]QBE49276.1 hypothetical protein EVS81_10880 [Leucobacter triazinivorans]